MKPYTPSKKVPATGYVWLALSLLGGALIGGIGFVLSHLWYFVVIYGVLMGIAGGRLLRWAIGRGQVRDPLVGALAGALLGVVIYASYHAAAFVDFRTGVVRRLMAESQLDAATAGRAFDTLLREQTGAPGVLGYLKLRAEEGSTYTTYFSPGGAVVAGPDFTARGGWAWLQWLAEAGLLLLLTTSAGQAATMRPFCESGPGWYARAANLVAAVSNQAGGRFLVGLQAGDAGVAALAEPEDRVPHPRLEVYAQHCPGRPEADVLLTLRQTSLSAKGQVTRRRVARGEVSPAQYAGLTQAARTEPEAARNADGEA